MIFLIKRTLLITIVLIHAPYVMVAQEISFDPPREARKAIQLEEKRYVQDSELNSFIMFGVQIPAHTIVVTSPTDFSGKAFLQKLQEYNQTFFHNARSRNYSDLQLLYLSDCAKKFLCENFDARINDDPFNRKFVSEEGNNGQINFILGNLMQQQRLLHQEVQALYKDRLEVLENFKNIMEKTSKKRDEDLENFLRRKKRVNDKAFEALMGYSSADDADDEDDCVA